MPLPMISSNSSPGPRRLRVMAIAGCILLSLGMVPSLGGARARSAVGHVVGPRKLTGLDGKKVAVWHKGRAQALVFLPLLTARGAAAALEELGRCQRRLTKEPIRFLGLVPEGTPKEALGKALAQARFQAPVAVDRGGALFKELDVAVRPTVVFLDAKHTVRGHVPYRKLNFCVAIEAQTRFLLGQIDAAALRRALNPEVQRAKQSAGSPAARFVKMGDMLLKAGKAAKAQEAAERALKLDPKLGAAHGLMGAALAAQGKCADAKAAFTRALELDPKEPHAAAAPKRCGGDR